MKWNVFPNYKIPIDFIWYKDENGKLEQFIEHIGWIETSDIQGLKEDHRKHLELVKR